jgi:hypothetical protein
MLIEPGDLGESVPEDEEELGGVESLFARGMELLEEGAFEELDTLIDKHTEVGELGLLDISLDDLLNESMGILDEATAVQEAKRKLTKDGGGLAPAERVELQERIDRWEMVHVWRKVASVAVFHRVVCKGCGERVEAFRHFMQRCEGVKDTKVQRWYAVKEYDWHLPREVIFTEEEAQMCFNCASFEGFSLKTGEVKAHGAF